LVKKDPRMFKVYTDFNEVKELSQQIGIKGTIKLLYQNIKKLKKTLNSNDLVNIYDSYYSEFLNNHKAVREINGFKVHVYNQIIFEYIEKKEQSGKTILDFGCGAGDLSLALNSIGYSVHGIDLSEHVLNIARSKIKAGKSNASIIFDNEDYFSLSNTYDYILFGDVIEHLSKNELEKILNKAFVLLAPGGEILINTPNGRVDAYGNNLFWSMISKLYRLTDKSEYRIHPTETDLSNAYYSQTHINVMYPHEIRSLLKKCGFHKQVFKFYNNKMVKMEKLLTYLGISTDMTIIALKG
jgi:2-polyprenyl-3-methyl-5-hydroxy-6-metoxy-1,4-benzoquinol methylase